MLTTRQKPSSSKRLRQHLEEWLGTPAASEQDLVHMVESGVPTRMINRLIDRGLKRNEVFEIIIPLRTWKHRKSRHEPLSREESERAVRAARILARAEVVIGDPQAALSWLRTPKNRFHGRSPLQMLGTEFGGRLVEQMLVQIDEGMYV